MMPKGFQECLYSVSVCSWSQILVWTRHGNLQLLHWSFDQVCVSWSCKWNPKVWCDTFHLVFAQVELHFNKCFTQHKSNRVNVHLIEKPYLLSPLLLLLSGEAKSDGSFQCFKLVFGMLGNLKYQCQYVLCIYDVSCFIFWTIYPHRLI